MIKSILALLLLLGVAFGQSNEVEKWKKHNLSIGILDDRTGLSLIGYTYNVRLTDMDECFIGGGTAILAFTGTVGWKHYFRKSRVSISSVLCGQYIEHLGFNGFMPTFSLTLEYNLANNTQVKWGGVGGMLFGGTSGESGSDILGLPFVSWDFRF